MPGVCGNALRRPATRGFVRDIEREKNPASCYARQKRRR